MTLKYLDKFCVHNIFSLEGEERMYVSWKEGPEQCCSAFSLPIHMTQSLQGPQSALTFPVNQG